jgi:hypothetical protein
VALAVLCASLTQLAMCTRAHLLFTTRSKLAMFLKMAGSPTYGANQTYSLNCANRKALVHVHHVVHSMLARVAAWPPSSSPDFP